MSGENQRDDDPDFLDDDFIIEDIAAKNEELDSLFEAPPAPAPSADPDAPPAKPLAATDAAGVAPDAEDLLFTDHSREPKFEGKPQFAEEEASTWDGQGLDLGALHEGDPVKPAAKADVEGEAEDGVLAAAEQSFTKELDSLLKGEDDFGPDTEEDLEVIGGDPNAPGADSSDGPSDGIAEFEQSGPFVLDDGDGAWQEDNAAAEATEAESTELELGVPLQAAASEEAAEIEPGWEPLPASNVDQLAEVGEVARTDAEGEPQVDAQDFTAPTFGGARRPALVGAGAAEEVEGHDIYAEEEVAEVVGTTAEPRRSAFRLVLSLAATLCVLAGGAVVVLKPEWLGMGASPERLQQVEVGRPMVAVNVPVPEPILDPSAGETRPDKPTVAVGTDPTLPPPVANEPPQPAVVVVPEPEKVPAPEPVPTVVEPTPPAVVATPEQPTLPTPEPAVPTVVEAPRPEAGWPVREAVPVAQAPGTDRQNLLRVNENLLIGETDPSVPPRAHTTEGVMPGSRAFAQLSNGNYFIGSVKTVDSERLTLNVDTGEVTLPVAALARLTELGSADYAELQRVTSGFVRLTNNNRLVGGILSGIADDHVVLEFRSNRVMLPKSLVGQVVQGENDAAVRLDTTSEEDDWLRRLVERQVGSGAPPVPQVPVKSTPQVPANPLPAPSPTPPSTGRSPR